MHEEKILTISLRANAKARGRRAPYSMMLLKQRVAEATKAREVKIGATLNSMLWSRGAKKPPARVRVKALIEDDVAKVELFGHDYAEFRPKTVAKREKLMDKLRAHLSPKEQQQEQLEKKIEGKEEKTEKKEEKKAEEAKEAPETAKAEK